MDKVIISIGRQFGSGGRSVGKLVAAHFGIDYWDKQLLARASKESGIGSQFFKDADESEPSSPLCSYNLDYPIGSMFMPFFSSGNSLSGSSLFKMQSDAIRGIAEKSCVIMGRCANYVLRDDPAVISVFLTAGIDWRIKRVTESSLYKGCNCDGKNLKDQILKIDKMRASYYNFYANSKWGDAATYDLCIDTSVFGIGTAAELICEAVEKKLKAK